jgi:tetratricopeptide (TPR) repeat protein
MRRGARVQEVGQTRGPLSEGRECLSKVLALSEVAGAQSGALRPDRLQRARALHWLAALARRQNDDGVGRAFYQESLKILRDLGNREGVASSLVQAGNVEFQQGDDVAARPLLEEALAIARDLDDRQGVIDALLFLGGVALHLGDGSAARTLLEEAMTTARTLEDRYLRSYLRQNLGHVALKEGNVAEAGVLFREAQVIAREFGDGTMIAHAIEGLAGLTAAKGQLARALRLAGAADAARKTTGVALPPTWRDVLEREFLPVRKASMEETTMWHEGQAMTPGQAVAYALEESEPCSLGLGGPPPNE